ncbi:MAG: hypothetical protein L3J02_07975 [Henriciella sp.]|nr:hypothetical protein [Henriciella sp.]
MADVKIVHNTAARRALVMLCKPGYGLNMNNRPYVLLAQHVLRHWLTGHI